MAKTAAASPNGTVNMMMIGADEALELRREHQQHHEQREAEGDGDAARCLVQRRRLAEIADAHVRSRDAAAPSASSDVHRVAKVDAGLQAWR